MSGVFISHASADKKYVDAFVDRIIKLGCALQPDEIFYSSGADTGVPSGEDLMSFVRSQVGAAKLVVALITPTYQTRAVCVAELGAAWSRVGNLFPLLVPGMPRTDLEGVLPSQFIKYADDSTALDELKDRIGEATGRPSTATTWGTNKARWLASIKPLARNLTVPKLATTAEMTALQEELADTKAALDESAREIEGLQQQLEEVSKTKDAAEVQRIRLPKDEIERFGALVDAASGALEGVPYVVRDALWHELAGHAMTWPNRFEDPTRWDAIDETTKDGFLIDGDDGLSPNLSFPKVRKAAVAVEAVGAFLDGDVSERFVGWFEGEYELPLELATRLVWRAVLED
jgi:hypothetical protein